MTCLVMGLLPMGFGSFDLPNDESRINEIRELMAAGFERQNCYSRTSARSGSSASTRLRLRTHSSQYGPRDGAKA
jgi:hypothetical protein